MASGTGTESAVQRRVVSAFLVQGAAGLLVIVGVTWLRAEEALGVLQTLGESAAVLLAIFVVFGATLSLLRFELTEEIYVSLAMTAYAAMFPILGVVISAWIAVLVAIGTRIAGMGGIGPVRVSMEDARVEYVRTFGLFGTYGIPIAVAGTLYHALGGRAPLEDVSLLSAGRIALCATVMILVNNLIMFRPALAYGYSVSRILTLDLIDCTTFLLTLPYAVVTAMCYPALGWPAVLALAFSGAVMNIVARNLAVTRRKSERQLVRLASLTNIGKTISLRNTTDQLLMAIYTECKKIVDCSLFSIALVDESTQELSFELDVREDVILPKERIPIGTGLNSWVVQQGRTLLLGSVADEARLGVKAIADSKATESWLGVPMTARDRTIGVISVEHYRKHAFSHDDLILLTAIANQAAVTIENARLYKDLEGLTYALEHRVMERTNALREVNLRLVAADRSKNQFLANMSHELRTPLNSIIGFSSVLLESSRSTLPQRLYKFLENIQAAGTHLLALINDILDLSKIEAGKIELRPEEFDLRDTLAAVERVMKGFLSETGVKIMSSVDPDLPSVFLDEGRVKQILFNLLSNAVKFSPAGSAIDLRVSHVPAPLSALSRDSLRIDVSDRGIGIAIDEQEKIFEEFYQTEEGRRSRRGGTGLGLSLTRNFVELQGGTISVKSAPGEGSVFTILLPLDFSTDLHPVPAGAGGQERARASTV